MLGASRCGQRADAPVPTTLAPPALAPLTEQVTPGNAAFLLRGDTSPFATLYAQTSSWPKSNPRLRCRLRDRSVLSARRSNVDLPCSAIEPCACPLHHDVPLTPPAGTLATESRDRAAQSRSRSGTFTVRGDMPNRPRHWPRSANLRAEPGTRRGVATKSGTVPLARWEGEGGSWAPDDRPRPRRTRAAALEPDARNTSSTLTAAWPLPTAGES
jgi:hypothetical protein